MKELEEIPAYLPNGAALKDAVQKAKDWLQEVEALQVREPGCWGGTGTLLMSPEPLLTPCLLQGSAVTLAGSTQSGTLVTSAMEHLHSLPWFLLVFLICIPSSLQLTACSKICKTSISKNLKLKSYCIMELHFKVTVAQ